MKTEMLIDSRLQVKKQRDRVDPKDKLKNLTQAKEFIETAHAMGATVVLVEGTWDLTHSGHTQHIREAAKYADLVLLRLASSEYARSYKGNNRPIEPFRTLVVNELEHVDAIYVDDTVIAPDRIVENAKILADLNPDVIALETEDDKLLLKLASTRYARGQLGSIIQPVVFTIDHYNSTSDIVKKIRTAVD
ncbi:MAG TPA: hypothetical protein VJB96_03355 [Patescibacteria group bacterium]|nr:hypothetical protein [Patescibacteria group bacterium]